jgi:hypothetical protein
MQFRHLKIKKSALSWKLSLKGLAGYRELANLSSKLRHMPEDFQADLTSFIFSQFKKWTEGFALGKYNLIYVGCLHAYEAPIYGILFVISTTVSRCSACRNNSHAPRLFGIKQGV